jgi:cytosine/adenosine deaminase-related metal-dependent hydrolase
MPGLVNAHTHLELSWMRRRIGPTDGFPAWIRRIIAERRSEAGPAQQDRIRAVEVAIDEARRAGTSLVGDVGNTMAAIGPLSASSLAGVFFRELIGFAPGDPEALVGRALAEIDAVSASESLRLSLAAHAPYSVSPSLFRAIRNAIDRRSGVPTAVHLAESADELEFLERGSGAWRTLLAELGAWTDAWRPPSCGPVEYLERVGFAGDRLLVIHGVHLSGDELAVLARMGATLVTCPRGNLSTGAGIPPVEAFQRSGVRVAIGTDSLASVDDLNVFSELAALRRLTNDVPAGTLLAWATRNGAEALGFAADFGAIAPGRRAALIAVRLPESVADVEEYLVGGIEPADVSWVDVDAMGAES